MPREGDVDPQNPEKSKDHQCIGISRSKDHQCIGISRGGRSTKIHAVVDALGNPLHIQLSAGNVNDVTVAQDLLSHVDFRGSTILADKAYSKWAFREYIADHDARPNQTNAIPGTVIGGCTRSAILLKTSFSSSKSFIASPLATTSWHAGSWALFSLPAFVYYLHNPCEYEF